MSAKKLIADIRPELDKLDALASNDAAWTVGAPAVSAWSVAQHVEHLSHANLMCLRAAALLVEGKDERIVARGSPNLAGRTVLTLGHIPRGKGRAPAPTVPGAEPDAAPVRARLAEGRAVLDALAANAAAVDAAPGRIPHPLLGEFSATQWLRFTAVHIRHHLSIVADVRQRSA